MSKQEAVLYLRSATTESLDEDPLRTQEQELTAFAKQNGYEITKVYQDIGSGLENVEQPVFQMLLQDAQCGLFHTLIVRDYARLSRNMSQREQVVNQLKQLDIILLTPQSQRSY